MSTIVIMPGGFHPFHAGHFALYQSAKKAFPGADLYVAATNDMSERPFPFQLKEKLAKLAGVEPGHFVQVKSPFQAKEITQNYNPDQDVLVFVRSEKDRTEQPKPGGTKKDGTPAYFQPWTGKNLQPFSKHAYMAYLPTVEFGPGITSATQIRKAWPTLNDKRKLAMVMSLYPAAQKNPKLAQNVVGMFDQVMGGQQGVAEGSLEELANTSLKVKEPKGLVNTNDRKQVTYKIMKFKSGKDTYLINFTVKGAPAFGKKSNWNAVNVAFGVREEQDEYSFGDEMNTDLTARNKNQFLIYSTVINAIRKFITEYNTEIDEIIMQGAGLRQEAMYQRFFQSAGKYFPGWHHDGKQSLVRDVPRQTGKKVREQGVAEEGYGTHPSQRVDPRTGKKYVPPKSPLGKGVAEGKESDPVTDAVISFYKPVVNDIHKEKVDNYVDQARELLQKTNDPSVRSKLIDIFKKGKENPYMQGGIVTTVGALLAGGVLSTAQNMGLSPAQTNLALQAILNTVIPTVVSRINGKNWSDTIKYTLASAGIGTGIAGAGLIEDDMPESMDYLEEK